MVCGGGMEDRAERQSLATTGKFSKLDWPTPKMLRAAHRLRGEALRDMALALRSWLKRRAAPPILAASRSAEKTNLGRSPIAPRGASAQPPNNYSFRPPNGRRQPSVTL
jgi:hypothetical protein